MIDRRNGVKEVWGKREVARNRPGGRGRAKGYGIICGSASEGAGLVVVRTAISAWASALCNIPFFS